MLLLTVHFLLVTSKHFRHDVSLREQHAASTLTVYLIQKARAHHVLQETLYLHSQYLRQPGTNLRNRFSAQGISAPLPEVKQLLPSILLKSSVSPLKSSVLPLTVLPTNCWDSLRQRRNSLSAWRHRWFATVSTRFSMEALQHFPSVRIAPAVWKGNTRASVPNVVRSFSGISTITLLR